MGRAAPLGGPLTELCADGYAGPHPREAHGFLLPWHAPVGDDSVSGSGLKRSAYSLKDVRPLRDALRGHPISMSCPCALTAPDSGRRISTRRPCGWLGVWFLSDADPRRGLPQTWIGHG